MGGDRMSVISIAEIAKKPIYHPDHYTQGGIECIKAIEAALTPEEYVGYCKGNIIKYIWRENLKNGIEDIKKARQYIDYLIESKGGKV